MHKLIAGLAGLLIAVPAFMAHAQAQTRKTKAPRGTATTADTSKLAGEMRKDSLLNQGRIPPTVAGSSPNGATANASSPKGPDSTSAAPDAKAAAKKRAQKTEQSPWNPVSASTFARSVYDSNIEHDRNDLASYGFIGGVAARYQSRKVRAPLVATYTVAKHSYTQVNEWDRVSQDLNVAASRRFNPRVTFETIGEISLKGSSEDRDIGDQYIVLPRLNYRLRPSERLRAYGVYRIKRYDIATDRNAVNRYGGLEFRQNVGKGGQWETGYRYETNSAQAERQSYTRRTYDTQYTANLPGRNQINGELKYRTQRYDKRAIVIDGQARPRMDHRFQPSISLTHLLSQRAELDVNYDFENRTSNDPKRGYRDHLVMVSTQYRW